MLASMIYTMTLNPCLDRHLEVDDLVLDDANRIKQETRYPAGKGIDVSVVIAELGGHSTALGFVGGYAGLELEGMLINRGVHCEFTRISGETRTNIHIFNRATGHQTSLNASGPTIKDAELGALCHQLRHLDPEPDYLVLSGSVPKGVNAKIYQQMTSWMHEQKVRVALDSDGEPFREAVRMRPYLIKPNLHELSRYFETDLRSADVQEIAVRCHHFLELGVEMVVVSMGSRGLLVRTAEITLRARVPKVEVLSTIGSGDSVIGGMVCELARGGSLVDAVRQGAACGTATAMTPGTALCRSEDVHQLMQQVQVEPLDVIT
ncbi:MAG: 1-phosphofructokinase [Acidobacteria bacterium]|nr:1-phosphofructokinase [Acidobacteriota bacterium]